MSVKDVHHSKGNTAVSSKGASNGSSWLHGSGRYPEPPRGNQPWPCRTATQLALLARLLSSESSSTALGGRSWRAASNSGDLVVLLCWQGSRRACCADGFSEHLPLGHFAARDVRHTAAAGVLTAAGRTAAGAVEATEPAPRARKAE